MIYFVNISIILLAIIFAFKISNEKRKYYTAVAAIILGFAFHLMEAFFSYKRGDCELSVSVSLLEEIDLCINYESKIMIFSQASIIAGFTVIFIGFALPKKN